MDVATIKCNVCLRELPVLEFHRDRTLPLGRRRTCKRCAIERARRSYDKSVMRTGGLSIVWKSMVQRCTNPAHVSFRNYGARGVCVCSEWLKDQNAFVEWARRSGYRAGLQLDRIDSNGGYSPENCRFVTPASNQHNRRDNIVDEKTVIAMRNSFAKGVSVAAIARLHGLNYRDAWNICHGKAWKEIQE